jgi:hypothetical protein
MYYGVAGREFLTRFVPKAAVGHDDLAKRVKNFADQLCVKFHSLTKPPTKGMSDTAVIVSEVQFLMTRKARHERAVACLPLR